MSHSRLTVYVGFLKDTKMSSSRGSNCWKHTRNEILQQVCSENTTPMTGLRVNVPEDIIVVWNLCEYPSERSSWFSRGKVFSTRDICWIFKSVLERKQSRKQKKWLEIRYKTNHYPTSLATSDQNMLWNYRCDWSAYDRPCCHWQVCLYFVFAHPWDIHWT